MTNYYYGIGRLNRLYRSTDTGVTWQQVFDFNTLQLSHIKLTVSRSNPYKVIAMGIDNNNMIRIYYSTDSGNSFTLAAGNYLFIPPFQLTNAQIVINYDIFARTSSFIYVVISTPSGSNFLSSNNGGISFSAIISSLDPADPPFYPNDRVREVFFNKLDPTLGLLKIGDKIYYTTTSGNSWISLTNSQSLSISSARGLFIKSFSPTHIRAYVMGSQNLYYLDSDLGLNFNPIPLQTNQATQLHNSLTPTLCDEYLILRNGGNLHIIEADSTLAQTIYYIQNPNITNLNSPDWDPNTSVTSPMFFICPQNGVISTITQNAALSSTNNGGQSWNSFNFNLEWDIEGSQIDCGCPERSVYNESQENCIDLDIQHATYPLIYCPGYLFTKCEGSGSGLPFLVSTDDNYAPYVGSTITFSPLSEDPQKYDGCYIVSEIDLFDSSLGGFTIEEAPILQEFTNCQDCQVGLLMLTNCLSGTIIYSDTTELYNYIGRTIILNYGDEENDCWNIETIYEVEIEEEDIIDLTDYIQTAIIYYDNCECCLEEPEEKERVEIRFYDKAVIQYHNNKYDKCDLNTNYIFSATYYKKYLEESYGVKHCCPTDENKYLIKKLISDHIMSQIENINYTTISE